MKIKFWGVRGSIPTPLTPAQLKERIAEIIRTITPSDLKDEDSRNALISRIPGTIGGNTTCVEVVLDSGVRLIIDAGSGIRELGLDLARRNFRQHEFHLFFTHYHWDHIQGFPFFDPLYVPGNRFFIYSPFEETETYLSEQMKFPFYPVTMEETMASSRKYILLNEGEYEVGGAKISWRRMNHPGGSIAYRISDGGKTLIFSTDTELREEDFVKNRNNCNFFEDVDMLILDSQYTLGEAIEKYNWGHTSYSLAVDFAVAWNIPMLGLFHHEPKYGDEKLIGILNSAREYLSYQAAGKVTIFMATESLQLTI